ncbi:bifunctional 5,10-methylenetetrahydrofolate dehydrogenase/5,10-methenyltetrahydrofolate cyclohydrolase [Candidatus Parcubacteria bacterium]|nr:bifunctional 5,10-methylenetetrahydrofolate dehydrogenase/5,10-methenyltetrahydrofolate cyclohydrolase [Candidatus Parcubacteria bacterium]
MAKILDGKKVSSERAAELVKKIQKLSVEPKLIIIQVGDLKESNTYIKHKIDFAKKVGIITEHKKYQENISEQEVIADILKYNADPAIHGVIVQLPLPRNIHTGEIVESIDPKKDVDCLTSKNIKLLFDETEAILPATTKGIVTLLQYYDIDLKGKRVTMIGESSLVGRPTTLALLNRMATVTVCHTHTVQLKEETKRADILIVAAGSPGLITPKHVSKNQIIIDVGITVKGKNKIVGDVEYEKVKDMVQAITPVPGGVGPMTVLSLFENVVDAATAQQKTIL